MGHTTDARKSPERAAAESATQPSADALTRELVLLNRRHTYDLAAPIASHRRLAGRLVVALKRRLRPWLYGTLLGVFDDQQEFNRTVVRHANASKERLDRAEAAAGRIETNRTAILEKIQDLDVKLESYFSVLSKRIDLIESGARPPRDSRSGVTPPRGGEVVE